MYDIAIIGAGVIGTSIARELSRYKLNIIMLERDNDISCGTTKANSAIVHAGFDAPFGTNKGKFNALGNKMFEEVCKDLNVRFDRVGSYVCAFEEDDLETLKELKENGERLGIPGLEIVTPEEIKKKEPHLSDKIIAGLYAPTAGITEPWELAIAYAENAIDNGASLKLNYEVSNIKKTNDGFEILSTKNETIKTKMIINCAGVYADKIYGMVEDEPEFTIRPRRGQYILLDKSSKGLVNSVIFPCPSKVGKGTLVVPTVDGNILIGPDSEMLEPDMKEAIQTTRDRMDYVKTLANKLIEDIPYYDTITTFSGLRAEPSNDDFIIGKSKVDNFLNVAGIKSPGLSSAPAIAVYMADMVADMIEGIEKNKDFNPIRRKRIRFEELSDTEKSEIIKKDPTYGRIICRCEMISEGEIIDAIHRPAGGRTLNGIKRRVRPGAGRCQGGFCGPRVIEILSRELGIDMLDICQENEGSEVLVEKTKS